VAYLTVGASTVAHGISAAPLAGSYARWLERQAPAALSPLELASAAPPGARGPATQQ